MAQQNWHFHSHLGQTFHVGLYHSPVSGNVVIYCNSKITTIDFGILESKRYAFFIGEELLEIQIKKKEEGYAYALEIDKETQTDLNKERLADEESDKKLLIYVLMGFAVFVAGMFLFIWVVRK